MSVDTNASSSEQASVQRRTTLLSIAAAAVLVLLKLGAGVITGSLALISAGIESSGDVLSAMMTFFAIRLGGQPADPGHPYGHRRAENLGALGEAAILAAGGVIVASKAIRRLVDPGGPPDTHWYVFAVVAFALALDSVRTIVSVRTARRYGSPALRSNALHFAGDMAGSVAVIVGLLLVRAGFARGDATAALLIAAVILAAAARLIVENANVLMDRTPAEAREAAERALARLQPDIELVRLRLRESAGRYFADVIVAVAPAAAVIEGHQAAELVEAALAGEMPGSDVVVHVEPRRRGLDLTDGVLAIALAEPLVKGVHDVTIYEHNGSASVSLHLKLPADLDLQTALAVARRIEQAIRTRPDVDDVQTHLEPAERPLSVRTADPDSERNEVREIERIVLEQTGRRARRVRLFATDAGRIVFLTLGIDAGSSLVAAHQLGGDLEDQLRRRVPDIADVIVHTETHAEPGAAAAAPGLRATRPAGGARP